MKTLLFISFGGFIGTAFRYALSGLPHKLTDISLPIGTLLVNFLGAFVIGLFMEYSLTRSFISDATRMFIAIGILGGFTTFSTFSYETISLFRTGNYSDAMFNFFSTNILCLGGTFIGIKVTHLFFAK